MKKIMVLGLIPARSGSKGLANKNIKKLAGKPLICHAIASGLKSKMLDKIIVSTDHKKIASIAKKCGAEVPFIRPKSLAKDDTSMVAVVKHAVKMIEKIKGRKIDIIVLLQPTSPLRSHKDIDCGIKKIIRTKADSVVSLCKLEYLCHPGLVKKVKGDRIHPYLKSKKVFNRRQDIPTLYRVNGALYIVRRDVLMNRNTFITKNTRALIMPKQRSVDIDTLFDFKMAEFILKRI